MAFANANAGSDVEEQERSPVRDSIVGMGEQPEPGFLADVRAVEDPMRTTGIFCEVQYVVMRKRGVRPTWISA